MIFLFPSGGEPSCASASAELKLPASRAKIASRCAGRKIAFHIGASRGLQFFAVFEIVAVQRLRRADENVLRHVGRARAAWRRAAERLGHAADLMRHGSATDAQVLDAERVRLARELRYLEPIAVEGIERERERHLAWQAVAARGAQ